jgi:hypothetical protein
MVKMIGTQDFRNPEDIIPRMPEAWNELFMKEMLPKVEKLTASVRADVKAVQPGNAKLDAKSILREDGTADQMVKPTHITDKDIAALVKGYELTYKQGLGLVFVMDRLVKTQQTSCLYVVFFDIASRKVVHSERVCEKAAGAGFRNYWFGSIKRVVKDLDEHYKKAKAAK